MAGKSAILAIRIIADASQAAKEIEGASKGASTLNKAAGIAAIGLGALAAGALDATKAAAEDAKGQAILAQALKNSTGATDDAISSVEDWITSTTKATGVTDDQLRPALATLARATGDTAKAQDALTLALDISAATGKDVESVSAALAKGYGGNTAALGKLVPGLDKATVKSGDMAKITDELARLTGGSAAAAAETAQGQYERMTVALDETKESIGAALLPAISALVGILMTAAQWAQDNAQVFLILGGVLGSLAAFVLVVTAATKVYNAVQTVASAVTRILTAAKESETLAWIKTNAQVVGATIKTAAYNVVQGVVRVATLAWVAVQWLLNAALAANPIGLVVLAITALIAGIILAYNKSETFRKIIDALWQGIKDLASVIWGALVGAFNALKKIIDPIIGAIQKLIGLISNIHLPSLPDWLPFGNSAASAAVAGAGVGTRAMATGTTGFGTRATAAPVVVNVHGAVDPQQTARMIQRTLHNADVRAGRRRFA